MSDVWKDPAHPAAAPSPAADGTAVAKRTIDDMRANPAGYGLAGVAYFVTALLVVFAACAVLFLGVLPGLLAQNEQVMAIGGAIGFIPYTLIIMGFTIAGFPIMSANLLRAFDQAATGGPAVGFGSAFGNGGDRKWTIVWFYFLSQLLMMVGFMLLYLPGFVVLAVTTFAFPIVVLEDVSAVRALQLGWDHVKANAVWHLVVWLLFFVLVIALELTIVGVIVIWPVMVAYQLAAYREAFGPAGASGTAAVA